MLRFAILRHDSPRGLHYDFFLEEADRLKTWALPRLPERGLEFSCDALPDHRLIYLDYEGPISGDRGTVARWDQGAYTIQRWTDDEIIVHLAGVKLVGEVHLRQIDGQWRFVWRADEGRER